MGEKAQQWIIQHPEDYALLRRVFDAADDREIPSKVTPQDKDALSEWVTRTVMNAPRLVAVSDLWPPRFHHEQAHRDRADFFRDD